MLKNWLSTNIQALSFALYLFVALTGATMYFHFYPFSFYWAHRQLGMALIVVSVFVIAPYLRAAGVKLSRVALFAVLAILLAIFGKVVGPLPWPKPPPTEATQRIIYSLTHMPLEQFAPVFGGDPDKVAGRLREVGFTVASNRQSLFEIARGSGRSDREALAALTDLLWKK